MTYPSNFKLFYEKQIRSVPALIYKHANAKMIEINPNSNKTHWQMSLRPVESWVCPDSQDLSDNSVDFKIVLVFVVGVSARECNFRNQRGRFPPL